MSRDLRPDQGNVALKRLARIVIADADHEHHRTKYSAAVGRAALALVHAKVESGGGQAQKPKVR